MGQNEFYAGSSAWLTKVGVQPHQEYTHVARWQSRYKVGRNSVYIGSRSGLGESEQKPVTTITGDVVGGWLCQGLTSGGIIRPDEGGRVIGLKVIFRRPFADFRREVQRAVERWVTDPRVAGSFDSE